jgi:hypothetical protein
MRSHTNRWLSVVKPPYSRLQWSHEGYLDVKNKRLYSHITAITCFIKRRRTQRTSPSSTVDIIDSRDTTTCAQHSACNGPIILNCKRRAPIAEHISHLEVPSYTHDNRYSGRHILHYTRPIRISGLYYGHESDQFVLLHGWGNTNPIYLMHI